MIAVAAQAGEGGIGMLGEQRGRKRAWDWPMQRQQTCELDNGIGDEPAKVQQTRCGVRQSRSQSQSQSQRQ